MNSDRAERFFFFFYRTPAALDERPGVSDRSAGREILPEPAADKDGDGLGEPPRPYHISNFKFVEAADFSEDDNTLRQRIRFKHRQKIGVGGSDKVIPADGDRGGLPEARAAEHPGKLVRHAARAGNDANGSRRVDARGIVPADHANPPASRRDDADRCGAENPHSPRARGGETFSDIPDGHALGHHMDERDAGGDGFKNR